MHHQFFQASPMKLLPLIGALLISAPTVQAFETLEGLDKATLEELDEYSCKWPIGHPNEKGFYFCGRTSLKDFSYCKLHLLYAYQPKGKKDDITDKDEVPEFIEKKIKSA